MSTTAIDPITRILTNAVEGPNIPWLDEPCLDSLYHKTNWGYPMISVNNYPRVATRVVLEHSLGRPIKHGYRALHKCDRRSCVRSSHLYEGTQKENMRDRDVRGRAKPPIGERNGRGWITETQVLQIRALRETGLKLAAIAQKFNLSIPHVCDIVNRRKWRHI